jgi:2-hydroxy-6-oxonona-2,4-dienedioate hydrolase
MIALHEATVRGRRAKVWIGGAGEPLLLIHGAWGGAAMHWAGVWDALAERFRVIAPELPGIGDGEAPGLASFDAYAGWLAELLVAVDADGAWCAGNSLGAAVAWQLGALLGARCRGLVLVNGPPPRPAPAAVRALAALAPQRLLRALYRQLSFAPPVLARAFADVTRAPRALTRVLADPPPAQLDVLVGLIARGASTARRPAAPLLLLWGASDRLPGTGPDAARKLQRTITGSELVLVPSAGHCPQLEQPAAFVDAITSFGDSLRGTARRTAFSSYAR